MPIALGESLPRSISLLVLDNEQDDVTFLSPIRRAPLCWKYRNYWHRALPGISKAS